MVAFVVGVVLCFNLPVALATPALALATLAAFAIALRFRRVSYAAWFGVGVLWGAATLAIMHWSRPPVALHGEAVKVTGVVRSLVEKDGGRLRFLFDPSRIDPYPAGSLLPRHVRVSWYRAEHSVRPGDVWRLTLRLKRPRGLLNPVRFDYERYLGAHRIDARAYVVKPEQAVRLDTRMSVARIRQSLVDRVHAAVGDTPGGAILRALALGDRRAFTDGLWRTLRRTGTSHLVAISGLHIGLIAALGWVLGGGLMRRLPPLNRRVPASVGAAVPALLLATAYALLAGWALPTGRAASMLALLVAGLWWRQSVSALSVLALSLTAMTASAPWTVLGVGVWLSYGAVALLVLAARTAPAGAGRLRRIVRLQCVLGVGMAALTLFFFGRTSWLAIPINLVAIPLFSLVLVPGSLAAVTGMVLLPQHPWTLAFVRAVVWSLDVTVSLLDRLASIHGISGTASWPVAVGIGVVLLAALLRGLVPRIWVLASATLLLWPAPPRGSATAPLRLTVLDVGQGTSVVARTPSRTLVYDTGPAWTGGAAAAFTLIPFLQERDLLPVDRLIVSHADRDHAGGVGILSAQDGYRAIASGESLEVPAVRCHSGQSWSWNGVRFRFLWPPVGTRLEGNAASCVLLVRYRERAVLLTGDIGVDVERQLLGRLPASIDVLLVPHHGSAHSSSAAFVERTRPAWAVMSAGFGNVYGLPAPGVVRRYRCVGAEVLNTAESGAVTITLGRDGGMWITAQRRDGRRYYHEPVYGAAFRPGEQIQYDSAQRSTPDCRQGKS